MCVVGAPVQSYSVISAYFCSSSSAVEVQGDTCLSELNMNFPTTKLASRIEKSNHRKELKQILTLFIYYFDDVLKVKDNEVTFNLSSN